MDNKISASGLSAMVALATGMPGELCEKFIKELCSLIADTLETGENVRIKGLGTFKIVEIESRKSVDVTTGEEIEIPSHSRVIFVPCKELASLVNAPFEAFEAEEVADDLPTDELMLDPEECDFESIYEEDDSETDELLQEDSDENTDSPNEVQDKDTDSTEADSTEAGSGENADSTEADSTEAGSGENADSSKETTGEDTEPKGNEGQGLRKCIVFGSEGMDDGNGEEGVNVSQRVISFGENEDALTSGPVILTAPSDSISITKDESGSEELEKPTESQTEVAIDTQETYAYNSGYESNEQTDETDNISAYIEPNEEEEGLNYAQSGSVESPRRGRFYRGFLLGFLTAAVVVALLFLLGIRYGYIPTEKQNSRLAEGKEVTAEKQSMQSGSHPAVATDSATMNEATNGGALHSGESEDTPDTTEVPTRPSDTKITAQGNDSREKPESLITYDTVSTTRYLTTMAQEHYGNYNLWPVIYKENESFLGHPDRIKPGTRVVVPPLSKYKIDPNKPEDVVAMKREGVKIYSKFKKK